MIRFDLSSIPAGATICEATLNLKEKSTRADQMILITVENGEVKFHSRESGAGGNAPQLAVRYLP